MKNPIHLKGYLMILLSALGFGSYGVWSKMIGDDFGVFSHAWVRSAIVLVLLVPVVFLTKQYKQVETKDWKWISIAVLFGIATQAPLYYAFNNMDIGTATLVFYSSYLIASYAIGKILFNEKIGLVKLASLILGVVGLGLVFGFSLGVFPLMALVLAIVNGVASGGEVAFTKKSTDKYSSLQISIYIWLGIFLSHLPVAFILKENLPGFDQSVSWLGMVAFALVGLVSFWVVVEGYKYVEASIGGLLGLTEIVFGVILGIIIFGEQLSPSTLVGGMLILIAAMLPDIVRLSQKKA